MGALLPAALRAGFGPRRARAARALALASFAGLLLSACGAGAAADLAAGATPTPAPATSAPGAGGPPAAKLELGRLASLSNYSYRADINCFPLAGSVYSPSDWRIDTPAVIVHVGGYDFSQSGSVWYRTPAPVDSTQSLAYASVVSQFQSLVGAPGVTVEEAGSCLVAGVAGRTWTAASAGASQVQASACVADATGALLQVSMSSSSAGGAIGTTFTVTGVGNVAPISAPASFKVG